MYKEIYLMLTESCPNRCEYCYIKNRSNPKTMSMDTVDFVMEKYKPNRVILFGGEPLARESLLEDIVKKYYGKTKFQVVTSTSINWERFIEFNKEYPLSEIQVSWDGFNMNRINAKKMDTSIKTYDNILYAIDKGVKFDIKCVISNDNVDQLLDIHNKFKEFKKKGVSGQFVIAHRELYKESFFYSLEENLIHTFDLDKMYKDHLNMIMAYLGRDSNFSSCDGGKYTVIDPDGRESCCTALSQSKDFEISSDEIQAPTKDPVCKKCKYNYICDGGCRYERYAVFVNDWKFHHLESTCRMMKIYEDTITRFLDSLSDDDRDRLLSIIVSYKKYRSNYYKE